MSHAFAELRGEQTGLVILAPRELVHLCSANDWQRALKVGERRSPSLDSEGFVHLSAPEQVHLPANRLFSARTDMLLLRLDPDLLAAPVRWERGVPADPESMTFPHLYGPLPLAAVTNVMPYLPGEGGSFDAWSQSGTT